MVFLIQELAQTELFRNVPEDLIRQVLAHAIPLELEPGELLLSPERENQHIYLLLSGTLALHFNSPDSPEIRELTRGYSVGEMSIIDNTTPSAYIKAKGYCRVFPVHRDLLLDFIQNAHPIAHNLLRLLTRWTKENTQRIISDQNYIAELTNQVNIDGLTGLYNRRWLENALPRILSQMIKVEQPLCILLIDVDHFKKYNDMQGHQGGDLVLMTMGKILESKIRPYDFAARFGGEEFIILLPNTIEADAIALAERIRQDIEHEVIITPDGDPMPGITVSIGLALSGPDSTSKALIAAADAQLYAAKQSGRNCIRY